MCFICKFHYIINQTMSNHNNWTNWCISKGTDFITYVKDKVWSSGISSIYNTSKSSVKWAWSWISIWQLYLSPWRLIGDYLFADVFNSCFFDIPQFPVSNPFLSFKEPNEDKLTPDDLVIVTSSPTIMTDDETHEEPHITEEERQQIKDALLLVMTCGNQSSGRNNGDK